MADIQFQYNIRPQETLGYSPFELFYGRKPNLPGFMQSSERHEYPNERIVRINKAQQEVMNKRRSIQRKSSKVLKTKLSIGDVILYKNLTKKQSSTKNR
jgi:hypothetical protein